MSLAPLARSSADGFEEGMGVSSYRAGSIAVGGQPGDTGGGGTSRFYES